MRIFASSIFSNKALINLFNNKQLKVPHDTNLVHKIMKTNEKNYKYAVSFSGVFENADNEELKIAASEISEQFIAQLFEHVTEHKSLAEIANSIVNILKAQYAVRKSEITQATEGAKTVVMNTKKADNVEEAEAEEVDESNNVAKSEPKRGAYHRHTTKAAQTTKTAKSIEKTAEKAEKKAEKEEVRQVAIASLTKADIKKMGIKFVQYSEKCVALTGETKPIKDEIKRLAGGHWNGFRQCRFIKNDNGHALAKAMGCKVYRKAE